MNHRSCHTTPAMLTAGDLRSPAFARLDTALYLIEKTTPTTLAITPWANTKIIAVNTHVIVCYAIISTGIFCLFSLQRNPRGISPLSLKNTPVPTFVDSVCHILILSDEVIARIKVCEDLMTAFDPYHSADKCCIRKHFFCWFSHHFFKICAHIYTISFSRYGAEYDRRSIKSGLSERLRSNHSL